MNVRIVVRSTANEKDKKNRSEAEQLYHTFKVKAAALHLSTFRSTMQDAGQFNPIVSNFDLNFLVEICLSFSKLNLPACRIIGDLPVLNLMVTHSS